jgi:hypothetical protein
MEISICGTKLIIGSDGEFPFLEPVQNQDFRANHLGADRVADHRTMRGRVNKAAHWQKFTAEIQGVVDGD